MLDPIGPSALQILDFIPNGCCVIVGEGIIEFWSQTLELWTKRLARDVVGKGLFEAFPELGEPRYRERIQGALRQGVPTLFSSALNPTFFPCTKPGGRPRIQETTLSRLEPDAQGRPRVLIVVSDVTEQFERGEKYRLARTVALQETAARRKSEERQRIIADLSMASILIGEVDGSIREANSSSCKLFGYEASDFKHLGMAELVQEPYHEHLQPLVTGERDLGEEDLEILCRRKDGTCFPANVIVRHLAFEEGAQFVAYIWDITERKRAEDVLRESQQRESLRVLAGGIAHDFNNLFGGVVGNLDLIESKMPSHSPIAPYLYRVRKEIQRATELSRKMLALSGGTPLLVADLELNAFLRDAQAQLSAALPPGAELRLLLAPEAIVVEADHAQLQQVLLGLLTNAGEALASGEGLVEITTGKADLDEETLAREFYSQAIEPGSYGFLRVRDTGTGISPEHLQKVFDPFFSTKFAGRGLSLPFIRSLVQGHGGGLTLESALGEGTTFTIFLPLQSALSPVIPAPPEVRDVAVPGLILVVDDEKTLRESTAELLQELGYRVETACNGREALEFYQSHMGQVALVLMDMTMPVMGGKEALESLRKLDPKAKVILTSGYSEQDVTQCFRDGELAGFLAKPYRMSDLARALGSSVGTP